MVIIVGVHYLNAWIDLMQSNGHDICRCHNRGFPTCEKILPLNHPFKACHPCLERERQNDKDIIDRQKKESMMN